MIFVRMFSVYKKTKNRRFQIPFLVTDCVDGKPNRGNKTAFSNSSGVVWTLQS